MADLVISERDAERLHDIAQRTKRFRLKIDMNDLELVFDSGFDGIRHYLDLQSGEIVMVEDRSDEAEEYDISERHVLISHQDSWDGYKDMEQFIEAVRNPHLRDLLAVAINGKGAFQRRYCTLP